MSIEQNLLVFHTLGSSTDASNGETNGRPLVQNGKIHLPGERMVYNVLRHERGFMALLFLRGVCLHLKDSVPYLLRVVELAAPNRAVKDWAVQAVVVDLCYPHLSFLQSNQVYTHSTSQPKHRDT